MFAGDGDPLMYTHRVARYNTVNDADRAATVQSTKVLIKTWIFEHPRSYRSNIIVGLERLLRFAETTPVPVESFSEHNQSKRTLVTFAFRFSSRPLVLSAYRSRFVPAF